MGVNHSPPKFQGILHLKMASVLSFQVRNFAGFFPGGLEKSQGIHGENFPGGSKKDSQGLLIGELNGSIFLEFPADHDGGSERLNDFCFENDRMGPYYIYCIYTIYLHLYWVHFRFGRFGDELLFGTQHVLNVHFGSRPKWTCKVQTQGLCFCDTRRVLVFRCPLNSVGVSHLSGAT